jgi:hypothetical protein
VAGLPKRAQRRAPEAGVLGLPATPAGHFKLYYLATVFHLTEQAVSAFSSPDELLEQHPFLTGYLEETPVPVERPARFWPDLVARFERGVSAHLPLRALREAAGLDHRGMTLLFAAGLIEEDSRFGALFDALQDATALHRPTLALLHAFWRDEDDVQPVRGQLRRLRELGLVQVANPEAPRVDWALHVPGAIWDVLRGETPEQPTPWLRHVPAQRAAQLGELLLPASLHEVVARLPALLESGETRTLVVRGPRRNGRRTLLASLAQRLGRGVLEVSCTAKPDEERMRTLGLMATLLHALPVVALEPAAGETIELAAPAGYDGPLGIALTKQGGVGGPGAQSALTLWLPMPDAAARALHWTAGLEGHAVEDMTQLARAFRMTSGNIRRAARLSRTHAALRGAAAVSLADAREASRALGRQALDTLATRLDGHGKLSSLVLSSETMADLRTLEARVKQREQLSAAVGEALRGQLNSGVRALFQGPSGTGKTLAAKLLAGELGLDLYRVELASTVSKYIGETEKNLSSVFALAEELDVMLLLDEGDSLLAQRTSVQTSNDRYANLETNYLLQRLESYEGVVLVTTNAGDHIDGAFARRMDVVVDFRAPEASERRRLWEVHLPADHEVDEPMLRGLSSRCTLSGGQIRNAVLHASLLAINDATRLSSRHLESAVVREYRKMGGVYPLRRLAGEGAS